jgi:hypothetical protein
MATWQMKLVKFRKMKVFLKVLYLSRKREKIIAEITPIILEELEIIEV